MRVVLDTNLWVSGLLWRGLPWQLLQLAEQGLVEPCMSAAMAAELAEVLAYPKLAPRLQQLGVTAAELAQRAVSLASVWDVPDFDGEPIVKADPDDDIFLRCAASVSATYIVSGDSHLLDLESYAAIPIVTARTFFVREFPHLTP
jgi:uncharacterized protein